MTKNLENSIYNYFIAYKKASLNKELDKLSVIAKDFNVEIQQIVDIFIKVNNYQPSKAQIG